jgi:hypothetical protein
VKRVGGSGWGGIGFFLHKVGRDFQGH